MTFNVYGITKRKICWPTPDKVCLHGGCGYCNDEKYKTLEVIEKYAEVNDLLDDYYYGLDNGFFNAETIPDQKRGINNDCTR